MVVHNFAGTDGTGPSAPLVQASDGNLYGTTSSGGKARCGPLHARLRDDLSDRTRWKLLDAARLQGRDGSNSEAAMIQGSDGALYGTTSGGGKNGDGSIFRITVPGAR